MKYVLTVVIILFLVVDLLGQSTSGGRAELITANQKIMQTGLNRSQQQRWTIELRANKENAEAWYNYYLWTERDRSISTAKRKQLLNAAVEESAQFISGTWQYSLLQFLNSEKKDSAALQQALLLGDKKIVYPYAIQFAIITGNRFKLPSYTTALNEIQPMSRGSYEYHYNTLMSANNNAVIYARGLYDLVPLAVMQHAFNIRKDIRLKFYDGLITDKENAYLCISTGKEILEKYPLATYTGLLVKLSKENNVDELRSHVSKDFSLTYLKEPQSWTDEEALMYKNYLPALIILYRHYRKIQDERWSEVEVFIKNIARRNGIEISVSKMLAG